LWALQKQIAVIPTLLWALPKQIAVIPTLLWALRKQIAVFFLYERRVISEKNTGKQT
jgi:hypothetical protein